MHLQIFIVNINDRIKNERSCIFLASDAVRPSDYAFQYFYIEFSPEILITTKIYIFLLEHL